ncbi:MAG TPA: FkbM family methyltransferase [Gemmatimonadaceae bacterium]|nr:FkbM family methyltransferase [Gemmatimonadaceae bacterium]
MSPVTTVVRAAYRRFFVGTRWYRLNLFIHELSLHGLGILNYEDEALSGERAALRKILASASAQSGSPVVLDVGANVGDFSRQVKAAAPSARVFAFEPHPAIFPRTQAAAKASGFEAIHAGCGGERGHLTLYDYSDARAGSQHASLYQGVIEGLHGAPAAAHDVEIVTVDDFLRERSIEHVLLLKIDTEGHEASVLRGARRAIGEGRIDFVQFEFNAMNLESRTFFRDLVELLPNFRLHRLLPDGWAPLPYSPLTCELFAYQNVVAVRNDLA